MKKDELTEISFAFALRIISLNEFLVLRRDYVISNQILKSGTSIGASISESKQAESRRDFVHKLSIANKEAFETEYWLKLLRESNRISSAQAASLISDCNRIQKMLVKSIRRIKSKG